MRTPTTAPRPCSLHCPPALASPHLISPLLSSPHLSPPLLSSSSPLSLSYTRPPPRPPRLAHAQVLLPNGLRAGGPGDFLASFGAAKGAQNGAMAAQWPPSTFVQHFTGGECRKERRLLGGLTASVVSDAACRRLPPRVNDCHRLPPNANECHRVPPSTTECY